MMFSFRPIALTLLVVLCISFAVVPVFGTPINYGNLIGDNVLYKSIIEDSSTDPTPLFGAPSISGDSLLFNPVSFGSSSGNGAFDITDGTLTSTLEAFSGNVIEKLLFAERGDYTLAGNGTANTNATVAAIMFIRITKADYHAITPVTGNVSMLFSPSDGTYNLVDDRGTLVPWYGSLAVDLTAMLAGAGVSGRATSVDITLDNQLMTFSEPGTLAYIKKKEAEGISITAIVPEPSTFALLAIGAISLLAYRRRSGV
jgi:hypothetical protein